MRSNIIAQYLTPNRIPHREEFAFFAAARRVCAAASAAFNQISVHVFTDIYSMHISVNIPLTLPPAQQFQSIRYDARAHSRPHASIIINYSHTETNRPTGHTHTHTPKTHKHKHRRHAGTRWFSTSPRQVGCVSFRFIIRPRTQKATLIWV